MGLAQLFTSNSQEEIHKRLPALEMALNVLQSDRTFDPLFETKTYLDAATKIAEEGTCKYVIFGHTHLAKKVSILSNKATYLNTGTWADTIRVPKEISNPKTDEERREALEDFLNDLKKNKLKNHIDPRSDYVRLQIKDNTVVNAESLSYQGGKP